MSKTVIIPDTPAAFRLQLFDRTWESNPGCKAYYHTSCDKRTKKFPWAKLFLLYRNRGGIPPQTRFGNKSTTAAGVKPAIFHPPPGMAAYGPSQLS